VARGCRRVKSSSTLCVGFSDAPKVASRRMRDATISSEPASSRVILGRLGASIHDRPRVSRTIEA
jgi:hypothetical protein